MGSLVSCLSDPIPSGNRSPPSQARRRSSTSSRVRGSGGRDSVMASVFMDGETLTTARVVVLPAELGLQLAPSPSPCHGHA
ncbi:hypothetical protein Zm00014a_007502 [Zea mays]|uniref:Uncharacterized protein n=1 Tax=Zea mays TaxID=4577 RepID=A0A3L6DXR9_MAIZE|nr:hypothetical protein Zm00014a_007502 [Zea mays]